MNKEYKKALSKVLKLIEKCEGDIDYLEFLINEELEKLSKK